MGVDARLAAAGRLNDSPMVKDRPFTLRPAREDDIAELALIEESAFSDPWPAPAFASVLAMPSAHVVVAADRRDIASGYCVLLTAADEGEIANLAVARHARRLGVGELLLSHALAVAQATGVVSVYLEVRASNEGAKALYAAKGFREVGRRRGYYQRPAEDALVLQWSDAGRRETVL
jgi:ribosomal-protein-alanine N-acetyltransferase